MIALLLAIGLMPTVAYAQDREEGGASNVPLVDSLGSSDANEQMGSESVQDDATLLDAASFEEAEQEVNERTAAELAAVSYEISGDLAESHGTLVDAMAAIAADGGTTYTVTVDGDDVIDAAVPVSGTKTITLTSAGTEASTITQSADSVRHFSISGATVVLENIVLDGGSVGGGVELGNAQAALTVGDKAVIRNCFAQQGGAIIASNGTISIEGGALESNKAAKTGGAIHSTGGKIIMTDGSVTGNASGNEGAGIYLSNAELNASGGSVDGNVANDTGGGIYGGSNATISLTGDFVVSKNESSWIGGGIAAYEAKSLTIADDVSVDGNQATYAGGGIGVVITPVFTMTGGSVTENVAEARGGGIYLQGSNIVASVADAAIDANVNNGYGAGGIHVNGRLKQPLIVQGVTSISNNITAGSGGAIFADTETRDGNLRVILDGSSNGAITVSGNEAYNSGGAIHLNLRSDVEAEGDVSIAGNTSINQSGGGIYAGQECNVTFDGGEISGNEAGAHGGGVYSFSSTYPGKLVMKNKTAVSGNHADGYGGGIYSGGCGNSSLYANLDLEGSTVFSGNSTTYPSFDPPANADADYPTLGYASVTAPFAHPLNNYDIDYKDPAYSLVFYYPGYSDGPDDEPIVGDRVIEKVKNSTDYQVLKSDDSKLGYSKAEHDFDTWYSYYTGSRTEVAPGTVIPVEKDMTFFAQWKDVEPEPSKVLSVARLFGPHRYATAAAVAAHGRAGESGGTVILASGADANFPDALAASSLSGAEGNAPIVLTDPNALSDDARSTILSLSPSKVYVIGSVWSVSASAENEVRSLVGSVERIGGADRQETADLIYAKVGAGRAKTAVIATAGKFPDSLSASSWAARTESPIFLAHFGGTGLSEKTREALRTGGFERILVLGDGYSVSAAVEAEARSLAGLPESAVVRLGGEDRFATSVKVAEWATSADRADHERLDFSNVAVTRGDKHADALAGGALQGRDGSVILLTDTRSAYGPALSMVAGRSGEVGEIRFFGDEYSVDVPVVRAFVKAVPYDSVAWKPSDEVAVPLD